MRADRLLTMLMLLQARGRLTAQTLASELEVSERTIYRDVEALSIAGIPVYTERGPGGGIQLLDGYRTNLTGLNADEVQALFMLTIPTAMDDLGMTQSLKTALSKLAAALQHDRRAEAIDSGRRVLLDTINENSAATAVSHLHIIHQAVQLDRLIDITVALSFGTMLRREVAPYGLVASAQKWYVVWAGNGRIDTTPLAQVREVHILDKQFERPASFDLADYWERWVTAVAANQPRYTVTAVIAPHLKPYFKQLFHTSIQPASLEAHHDKEGWCTYMITFSNLEEARARLLALGSAVRVLSPAPLRLTIADYARQTLLQYKSKDD